mmetsp:Transcript_18057/g.26810  ORF Transcript_18057/g.26810 Transcript_18057/m.26810 type:complete len:197 (-) Transcript_18057:159-749(-)
MRQLTIPATTGWPGSPSVSKHGAFVNILDAKATMEADQRNIMRWIGGNHERVNAVIKRKFIRPAMYWACTEMGDAAVLRQVVECGVVSKEQAVQIALEENLVQDICEYVGKEEGNYRDNPGCLRYLLEMGCNPDGDEDDGYPDSPLQNAITIGNYELVRILLEYGANVDDLNLRRIDLDEIPDDIFETLQDAGVVE